MEPQTVLGLVNDAYTEASEAFRSNIAEKIQKTIVEPQVNAIETRLQTVQHENDRIKRRHDAQAEYIKKVVRERNYERSEKERFAAELTNFETRYDHLVQRTRNEQRALLDENQRLDTEVAQLRALLMEEAQQRFRADGQAMDLLHANRHMDKQLQNIGKFHRTELKLAGVPAPGEPHSYS